MTCITNAEYVVVDLSLFVGSVTIWKRIVWKSVTSWLKWKRENLVMNRAKSSGSGCSRFGKGLSWSAQAQFRSCRLNSTRLPIFLFHNSQINSTLQWFQLQFPRRVGQRDVQNSPSSKDSFLKALEGPQGLVVGWNCLIGYSLYFPLFCSIRELFPSLYFQFFRYQLAPKNATIFRTCSTDTGLLLLVVAPQVPLCYRCIPQSHTSHRSTPRPLKELTKKQATPNSPSTVSIIVTMLGNL